MTRVDRTRGKVQEEIQKVHSNIGSTDVAKCLFQRIKCSHWNILSGYIEYIGLPVSIPLGAISLAGVSVSGVTTALTKKYQKKLSKVMKLTDIIMPAIAVFEMCVSKALRNGRIDEEVFNLLQTFHLKMMNKLTGVDRKREAENRNQFEKNLLEEINEIKKNRV